MAKGKHTDHTQHPHAFTLGGLFESVEDPVSATIEEIRAEASKAVTDACLAEYDDLHQRAMSMLPFLHLSDPTQATLEDAARGYTLHMYAEQAARKLHPRIKDPQLSAEIEAQRFDHKANLRRFAQLLATVLGAEERVEAAKVKAGADPRIATN